MTICKKCFNLTLRPVRHNCEVGSYSLSKGCGGETVLITSYFDFTNYDVVKLYLNDERSLSLLHEKFPNETKFPIHASRVISKEYIDEVPRFLPYLPFYREDIPNKERFMILEHLKSKIKAYENFEGLEYNSTYINKVLQMSFPSKIKTKLDKINKK